MVLSDNYVVAAVKYRFSLRYPAAGPCGRSNSSTDDVALATDRLNGWVKCSYDSLVVAFLRHARLNALGQMTIG